MKTQGKLIVIEGLDGTGKTTQAELLARKLNSAGFNAMATAEPTGGAIGLLIREALSGRHAFSSPALSALFLADRIEHNVRQSDGIKALRESGKTVISDRYYYSTFAYQGMDGREGDLERIIRQNLDCPDIAKPDLCVFLDMEPQKCMERICESRNPDAIDIFENIKALTKIRERFHFVLEMLSREQNIAVIEADNTVENINDKIYDCVKKILV